MESGTGSLNDLRLSEVLDRLAEGACRAAARLVEINLAGAAGDPRLTEVAGRVKAAAEARAETLAKASD